MSAGRASTARPVGRGLAAWCLVGCLVALATVYVRSGACSLENSHCVSSARTQVYAGVLRDREGRRLLRDQTVAFYFTSLGSRPIDVRTDKAGRFCFRWYSDDVPEAFRAARLGPEVIRLPGETPAMPCPTVGPKVAWSKRQDAGSSWHVHLPMWLALAGLLTSLAALVQPTRLSLRMSYFLSGLAVLGALLALAG